MLILTRRVGETIRIGDDVIIHNLGYKRDASRIGITAPKSISIYRQEIYEKKFKMSDVISKTNTNLNLKSELEVKIKEQPIITVKKKRLKTSDKFFLLKEIHCEI